MTRKTSNTDSALPGDELSRLRTRIARLEKAKRQLEISLETITEHADLIEGQLLEAQNTLEIKVEERTQELARKNAQLQQEIHDRQRAESALRRSEELHRLILGCAGEGVFGLDPQGRHTFVNPAASQLFGYTEAELLGQKGHPLWHHSQPDGTPLAETRSRIMQAYHQSQTVRVDDEVFWHKNGTCFPVEYVSTPMLENGAPIGVVVTFNDISERKQTQQRLEYEALHDALTGLPNRVLFLRRLQACLLRCQQEPGYRFAVLFMDLDRFKVVNDGLGHLVGDQLLIQIAQRLRVGLHNGDTLARFGGDEFTLLLERLDSIQQIERLAADIQDALSAPFYLRGEKLFTAVSIGIAIGSRQYQQADAILRDADIAMYRAKTQRNKYYEIFDQKMHIQALARLHLENDLRVALERRELDVFYQPIIQVHDHKLHGFEALLRWRHPHKGLLSPLEFIALAEETGEIIPIGIWVMEQACCQLQLWRQRYPELPDLSISVNLSGKQFGAPQLATQIQQVLDYCRFPPGCLKLEVTESILLDNINNASSMLKRLKQMGVKICIDDFGTGYSSLSYLHQLPFDILKIDRSFVQHINEKSTHLEIINTIMLLARNLRMEVIAEGVEVAEQAEHLRRLHCDYLQGYLYSRPIPAAAAETLLRLYRDAQG